MVAKILCASTMRKPAQDELVGRDHLLPVDAQILSRLVRPACHRQAPGDERPGVTRPAGLHRQPTEIDLAALPHDFLTGGAAQLARRRLQTTLEQIHAEGQHVEQPFGRLRLLELGQQLPELAQALARMGRITTGSLQGRAHGQRHTPRRAKQVAQYRHGWHARLRDPDGTTADVTNSAARIGKQQRRTAGTQRTITHGCHFQHRRNRLRNPAQLAQGFQLRDEFAQVAISHVSLSKRNSKNSGDSKGCQVSASTHRQYRRIPLRRASCCD